MSAGRYIVARLVLTVPMLFVLLTVIFVILRVMPGDPVLAMLGGHNVSMELIQQYRARMGVDRPLYVQYVAYMYDLARGNLGVSLRTNRPVLTEILEKFPATIELAVFGMLWALLLGMGSGIIAAIRADTPADHVLRIFNIGSFAIPVFWIGLILQILFGVGLKVLPVGGRLDPVAAAFFSPVTRFYLLDALLRGDWRLVLDVLKHLALPSFTLGLVISGIIGRMTRASMLEVLNKDYVRTARSKGLSEPRVVLKHALKNALIPIVTVLGLQFALLLAGAILTETVYSWPGIARYLLVSIDARDFPAIQGTVVFIAVFISSVNLLVDVLYSQIDPRVRY